MITSMILAVTAWAAATPVPVVFDKEFSAIQPLVGVWEFVADPSRPKPGGTSLPSVAPQLMVRGDRWTVGPEAGIAARLSALFKGLPETMLDQVKAYYYFPLALLKNREFTDGDRSVEIMPVSGKVDQAGGIAFGMVDPASYWVLRLNANENNVMLFEYVKARRESRFRYTATLVSGHWYTLTARIAGKRLTALLEGKFLFYYDLPRPVSGKLGLWSKADSVTRFRRFVLSPHAPA